MYAEISVSICMFSYLSICSHKEDTTIRLSSDSELYVGWVELKSELFFLFYNLKHCHNCSQNYLHGFNIFYGKIQRKQK